jgi:titin
MQAASFKEQTMRRLSWLRKRMTNRPQNGHTTFRPRLEGLEDRFLPSTFTVTNVNDSGPGSLRQAIVNANGSTGNTIAFDIPGSGVHTITPLTPLPALMSAGTTLNGYTQPGASANTLAVGDNAVLLIELDGSAAGTGADGLDVTGGGCTVRGLVINRFTGNGIGLSAAGHDVVAGNFLGTDPTGTVAEGNGNTSGLNFPGYGVYVASDSPSDVIGGTTPAARNLLSGNVDGGAALVSTGGALQGNYVGTDVTGLKALPNQGVGIDLLADGNTVGGATAGAGNVISGNAAPSGGVGGYGIAVGGNPQSTATPPRSFVQGNLIGLGADGATMVGNHSIGVYVTQSARNVQFGGTTAAARNVISSNGFGLWIDSSPTGIVVEGNYIGTDATGTVARGNGSTGAGQSGIYTASPGTVIGGTTPGAGNLISGNSGIGVTLDHADGSTVLGNLIGLNASGTAALGNEDGIYVSQTVNSVIGGTTAAARNVISGNTGRGVIIGAGSGNHVQGNLIGTNAAGTAALGNGTDGVEVLSGATGTVIGGTTAGARNVISGNGQDGVFLSGSGTSGNTVAGNFIGLNKAGTAALHNGGNGVTINASGNTVGGKVTGAGNLIEYNTRAGVDVAGGTGDCILGNGIYGNGGGGIVLAAGANNNQPAPQITFAKAETTSTVIEGVLLAAPSTTYTIEFFASPTPDPSGFGQGQTFLKRITMVATDAFGLATFIVRLPAVPAGQFITATATDANNDTSAFSSAFAVS